MILDPLPLWSVLAEPFEGLREVDRVRRGVLVATQTPRPPVGPTPHTVIHQQDKLAVRFYGPLQSSKTPVVLVPSLINRAYILDLEPGRSLVEALVKAGHPTYLVDFGIPGPEDADEDVGYVVLELLHRVMVRVCRHSKRPAAHLFGYCMGGTLAAIYAALRPELVASLCTLAAPVEFRHGGRFRDFVAQIEVQKSLDGDGMMPVRTMLPAFKMLDPLGNWTKYKGIEAASHKAESLAMAMRRERWLEENIPMAGAFAVEFIENGYQKDRLIAGTWQIRGELVDLAKIRCPTLVVACDGDFVSPKAAVLPLAGKIGENARAITLPTGHIGVVVGSQGPKTFYPLLDRWFTHGEIA